MNAEGIRQCGTVCESFYFDPAYRPAIAKELDEADEVVTRTVTDDMRLFARRSQDHMSVAMFMGQLAPNRLVALAVTARMGLTGDHLPYPANHVAAKLAALPPEDRDEAWELFGEGVEP